MKTPPADIQSLLADLRAALEYLCGDRLAQLVLEAPTPRRLSREPTASCLRHLYLAKQEGITPKMHSGIRNQFGLRFVELVSFLGVCWTACRVESIHIEVSPEWVWQILIEPWWKQLQLLKGRQFETAEKLGRLLCSLGLLERIRHSYTERSVRKSRSSRRVWR